MKKTLVVLLAVAMVFAFATSAMALSDISDEKSATQDAINRFAAFGVIEGYPDGTFMPNNTITREEFAKIVIVYTNNTVLANALVNNTSEFSDVKAGEWYSGYVNAAVALGYFQGMGDGTFGIGKNVTYGQVVTVLLRLAGYTDELPGSWPYDYIAQASKGDTKLVQAATAFDATAPATRKDVVLMANTLLDADVKYYDTNSKQFLSLSTPSTVSAQYGFDAKETTATVAVSYDAKKGITINNKALADSFAISNGFNLLEIDGKTAVIFTNDDSEVVYVDLKNAYVKGLVTAASSTKVTVGGVEYTLASGQSATKGQYVLLTVGADKTVTVDVLTESNNSMIVSKVESNKISGYAINTMTSITIAKDEKFIVVKDGAIAAITDIEAGDLVYARGTINSVEVYEVLSAYGDVAISSLTGASDGSVASLVIDGITYTSPSIQYKDSDMNSFGDFVTSTYTSNKLKDVVGTFYTDKYGAAVAMVYGKLTAPVTTVIGVVTGATPYKAVSGGSLTAEPELKGWSDITVLNLSGETVKYSIKDNGLTSGSAIFTGAGLLGGEELAKGDIVKATLNEEGIVTALERVDLSGTSKEVATNKTFSTITIGDTVYNLAADTPVVQIYGSTNKTIKVNKASEVISALNGKTVNVVMNTAGTAVSYIVAGELTAVSADEKRVVFVSEYVEGNKVQFEGDANLYEKTSDMSNNAEKGDIVTYTLTNGKVSAITKKVDVSAVEIKKVSAVNGSVVDGKIIGTKAVVYVYDNNGTAGTIGNFSGMGTVADIVKDAYVGFADSATEAGVTVYNTIIIVK